ncbi:MAG: acyl--CoA ligase [Betaproteobacteria bacterium]|nr:acyl--CoA ligase [Betaproteobacteria bacterium]
MNTEEIRALAFATIPDMLRLHAAGTPRRHALLLGEGGLDYAGLDVLVDRVAASLQGAGLAPRDAIAICAATSIEYAALFLGALRAGVAVAPLAPSSTGEEIVNMALDAGAKRFFHDAAAAQRLGKAIERLDVPRIALDGSVCGTPFRTWLAPEGVRPQPVALQPDWAFNLIYSSGTTGTPKGVEQSHAMRWGHVLRAAPYGYGPDSVTLISTPLYSNTTLVCFFPALALGGTVVLMPKFDAADYLALAARHRVTHTMLVPVQYQRIMAQANFGDHDLSSFRCKLSTSAPFRAELKADVLARWPGGLVEIYGMTEGGGNCILVAHEHPDKLHTVGRPPAGHDVRIIDTDGRELARGETGEVVGNSAIMMTAYHRRPDRTAEAEWYDGSGKRFIRTGDVGRFDEDGFLVLLDRRKDMIISGGFNVYPSDIEAVLRGYPGIAEAAVVGVPSERWGETPVAFVVPQDGAGLIPQALLEWTNARVGKIQRLAAVELVESLPRNGIGKVLKRELRETYCSRPRSVA